MANRLGWLDVASRMREHVPELEAFAAQVKADGFSDAVLLGMGGSSLAPEVLRDFGSFRYLIFAVGLLLIMLYRPSGIWPAGSKR